MDSSDADAQAICDAVIRMNMRFAKMNSLEQQKRVLDRTRYPTRLVHKRPTYFVEFGIRVHGFEGISASRPRDYSPSCHRNAESE